MMLADPAAIREVFTAPADLMHAGDANEILRPMLGPSSVLLLDGAEHMHQRKLMLPAFHGERLRRYREIMVEATERVLARLARRRAARAASARAGDHARGHRPRRVRRARARRRHDRLRALLSDVLDRLTRVRRMVADRRARPGSPADRRAVPARARGRRRRASPPHRRAPRRARPRRSATTSSRCCCSPATRTAAGLSDARAARRAHDAARRRPRDDGELARVGLRAARAHAGRARARRGRRRLRRGGGARDAAPAPGDRRRRPAADARRRDRRPPAARRARS